MSKRRSADRSDDAGAVGALRERLERWLQLFAMELGRGLNRNEAQGLWGELWIIRRFLHPAWGAKAVSAWTASDADEKDFRLGPVSVEAKTTRAGRPRVVRINGERQLEVPEHSCLLLAVIDVDAHEGGSGETLPDGVRETRSLFQGSAAIEFNSRLTRRGYLDDDERLYRTTRYSEQATIWHEVRPDFPRIISRQLPEGVGGVDYVIVVDSCVAWRLGETSELPIVLAGGLAHEP